jgi:hypothetical protein
MNLWRTHFKVAILLPIFLFLTSAVSHAERGFVDTVNMWQEVEGKTAQYRLLLQNLYAEVEISQRHDRSRTNAEFGRRLARDYPGSRFFSGSHGVLAVNSYTTIQFDASWNINHLMQKFGSLEKTYDFRAQIFTATDGPNRVVFRIDLGRPERSHFTSASIPAISVHAEQVWAKRRPSANSHSPLKDLLNDVYAHRLAGSGTRMDKLAEELVSTPSERARVLQIAGELYAGDVPGRAGQGTAGKSGSKQAPQVMDLPSGSSLVGIIFKSIPWYVYLFLLLGLVLRLATPVPGKLSLLKWLLQYLISQRQEKSPTEEWRRGDDGEEDWFGEKSAPPRSRSDKPQVWTMQVLGSLEWKRFETVCAEYFRMIGYDPRETRIGADGGVDIWVYKSGMQKPVGIVQCKAWSNKVGVKPVRELFGVMAAEGVANGKFITAGEFTSEALQFAEGKRLKLISGEAFIAAIRKLPEEKQEELLNLAVDGDYRTPTCPQCGTKMKLRDGGRPFWGCARYPRCKAVLAYKNREKE